MTAVDVQRRICGSAGCDIDSVVTQLYLSAKIANRLVSYINYIRFYFYNKTFNIISPLPPPTGSMVRNEGGKRNKKHTHTLIRNIKPPGDYSVKTEP